jgi:hypothetical protein
MENLEKINGFDPDLPILEQIKTYLYPGPCVYLIHMLQPLKHAQHYVGSTGDLFGRLRIYRRGSSDCSRFMAAVHRLGIPWTLARVWSFDTDAGAREWEYRFKKGCDGKQHIKPLSVCPFCRPQYLAGVRASMARTRARRRLEIGTP